MKICCWISLPTRCRPVLTRQREVKAKFLSSIATNKRQCPLISRQKAVFLLSTMGGVITSHPPSTCWMIRIWGRRGRRPVQTDSDLDAFDTYLKNPKPTPWPGRWWTPGPKACGLRKINPAGGNPAHGV
ncbi:MAG: hypothetical protein R2860_16250 [Desulfobacterales bacterium]